MNERQFPVRMVRIDLPKSPALVPITTFGIEQLRQITRQGEAYDVFLKKPRNPKHHRQFFVTLAKIAEAIPPVKVSDGKGGFQTVIATTDSLLNELKLRLGYFDWAQKFDGTVEKHPRSVNFATMGEDEFREFHQAAILFFMEALPGISWPELRRAIEEFIRS